MLHDGNGWVHCRCGRRHWGLHGAAGLVLLGRPHLGEAPESVLLQLRAAWTHEGGTWGLPGGARDSHEDVVTAALREAREEVGLDPSAVRVVGRTVGADHGDWSYTYVLARADAGVQVRVGNEESDEIRWVPLDGVAGLLLHPALAPDWESLREVLRDVDAA